MLTLQDFSSFLILFSFRIFSLAHLLLLAYGAGTDYGALKYSLFGFAILVMRADLLILSFSHAYIGAPPQFRLYLDRRASSYDGQAFSFPPGPGSRQKGGEEGGEEGGRRACGTAQGRGAGGEGSVQQAGALDVATAAADGDAAPPTHRPRASRLPARDPAGEHPARRRAAGGGCLRLPPRARLAAQGGALAPVRARGRLPDKVSAACTQ